MKRLKALMAALALAIVATMAMGGVTVDLTAAGAEYGTAVISYDD